jgi:hypothetical protein
MLLQPTTVLGECLQDCKGSWDTSLMPYALLGLTTVLRPPLLRPLQSCEQAV